MITSMKPWQMLISHDLLIALTGWMETVSSVLDVRYQLPWRSLSCTLTAGCFSPTSWLTHSYSSVYLAKGKTTNIYASSQYTFRVAHDFGMLWKQTFFTSHRDKIKNGPCVQDLLDAIPLPAALAIIKVPGHSKSDSLGVKGNHSQCLRKKMLLLWDP